MVTTVDSIIDGILRREGEGTPPYLAKDDSGGRTSWGISERAHPNAWANGPPSKETAREIYRWHYVKPFAALINVGVDDRIVSAVVDDAVMRGVSDAAKRLQWVLGVSIDGIVGRVTVAAAVQLDPDILLTRYVTERAIRITRLVQRRPSDLTNITGWITRILSFLPYAEG